LFCRGGDRIALVGNLDAENFRHSDVFNDVFPYTEGVGQDLVRLLRRLDPRSIALNYAPDDPTADGLTHGMYLNFKAT